MKETREIIQKPAGENVEMQPAFEPHVAPGPGRYPAYRELYAQEGFQLLDYWRAIRKRLWLVIGIAVLVTLLTAIYMAKKPNIYQANAVIQVDLEQVNQDLVTNDRQRPISNPDPSYFNTQLQLLGSDSLLRRVIKEHNLDTNKDFQVAKNESSVSAWRSMLKAVGLASDLPKRDTRDAQELSSNNSGLVTADEIAEAIRLAPYVEVIKRTLDIQPVRDSRTTVKDTRLIDVSFRHTDPELAAFVVNAIGETFTNANQEKRSGTSRKTNDFLQKRIADLQSDIKSDEVKLVEMKRSEGILKTDGEQTLVLSRLSGLNKQLLDAENQRKNAEAEYFSVKDSPERVRALVDAESARIIADRDISDLTLRNETQKKISDLRANRARMLEEYKETAPEIKEIDTQIASLEESINKVLDRNSTRIDEYRDRAAKVMLSNLRTKYERAKDEEDKIRASFNEQYNQAQAQNQGGVLLRLLEQNIDTNRGFLENLQKTQSGNDVASQGSDNNISVAGFAIPPDTAVSPRRLTTVMAALFLSTIFGMGLALFLE
ncbi:MAG TPA: GumC family protein, partial [Pyrinomonadaceae bacterium]|nr:GumC family protein [Pyrinomonadaceae bacterium]